jgi:hypothetical protein
VARVALGTGVVFAAYLGVVVSVGLFAIIGDDELRVIGWRWVFELAIPMVVLAVNAVGAFLITAREPAGRRRRRLGRWAAWDRAAAWALRACGVGPIVGFGWVLVYGIFDELGYLVFRASPVILMLCPALTMVRLQRLTQRAGRPRVAEHAAIAGCGLSAAFLGVWFTGLEKGWVYAVFVVSIVTVLVCYLWCVGLLFMVTRSLCAATKEARAAWREADASGAA